MENVHPLFVHFPIALLSVGLICDVAGVVLKKDSLSSAGWWLQAFGVAAAATAAVTGLLAAPSLLQSESAHEVMEAHETLELIAVGVFILLFVWRSVGRTRLPRKTVLTVIFFVVYAAAVGILLYGAHLGGRLVYEFGIGVSAVPAVEDGHEHH